MAKFCTMTALCLVVTSFLSHTSLAVIPDIDAEAKALFSDLDRLIYPNLQNADTDQTFPYQGTYNSLRTQGKSTEFAFETTISGPLLQCVRSATVKSNRELGNQIIARIHQFIETYRSNGVQDGDIPSVGKLSNIIIVIESYGRE